MPGEFEDVLREIKEPGNDRRRRQALESSLHLNNVEVLSGGSWVEFGGAIWRGARAEVDGFWVGRTTEA